MRHFGALILFAGMVSAVFGVVGREDAGEQLKYGVKIFFEFVGIGLLLGWLLYFLPL